MQDKLSRLSREARQAVQQRSWPQVAMLAQQIKQEFKDDPEGYFLAGLAAKSARANHQATSEFELALKLDANRYDAAVELANQYLFLLRHGAAYQLLKQHEHQLGNSPFYLDMAGKIYTALGMHVDAWPLYEKANQLQPGLDTLRVNLASCGVLLGKVEQARAIYQSLIDKYPEHQRNHYELSKLEKAKDFSHLEQMKSILNANHLPPEKNIFLYYAIGKELEDLEQWQESFHYYQLAGESVLKVSNYDVSRDIQLIEKIIQCCNADWLSKNAAVSNNDKPSKTPIFIVGLPRTGTTLTERIIASHSQVESADETFFMQIAIRQSAGVGGFEDVDQAIIEAAAKGDIQTIGQSYLNSVAYRLTDKPNFIDGFPFNFLYLGFIAKALPNARIIYLRRNPMDACFAMYKQSFFKFAYSLDNLGQYFVAQNKLRRHWQELLGERLIEIDYESLVAEPEQQTRALLASLGLEFEESCLEFDKNPTASATASTLQVREKVHTRSVNKWKNFAEELAPLKQFLEAAGIDVS